MINILLTGANGYIGKRLIPLLQIRGFNIICTVRDKNRFNYLGNDNIEVVECDFLKYEDIENVLPNREIDYAYYLMHSMTESSDDFEKKEIIVARNFIKLANRTNIKQVIYLTGMINERDLSPHLRSRKLVEELLSSGNFHLTALRAGIIIGSGSSSFEMIRDIVEKIPIMVAPRWIKSKCQPIDIGNILSILVKTLGQKDLYDRDFDVAGEEVLTYMQMLKGYANIRKLKRHIVVVPVLTPRLSSYWFHLITSQSYTLARHLIDSMRVDFIARDNFLIKYLDIETISYEDSIAKAFDKIKQNAVISSWKDSLFYSKIDPKTDKYLVVPDYGCMKNVVRVMVKNRDKTIDVIWNIGKSNRWYFAHWLWSIRGLIDKICGGVGINRHRREDDEIHNGDCIDFWRVIKANKKEGELLLYAEMKLPGEAWLDFSVKDGLLTQTSTFRPLGVFGRLYWYSILPIHKYIFNGMAKKIVKQSNK